MIDRQELYPLLFKPIYIPRMWGGDMMGEALNRDVPKTDALAIGESWDVVDRDEQVSVVTNGELAGKRLSELVAHYKRDLVGREFTGDKFPVFVKIIDAGKRLSLQVHPDRQNCYELGDDAEHKDEMWYILKNKPKAKVFAGLSAHTTKMKFMEGLDDFSLIEESLQVFDTAPRDAYCINAGTIHTIGEGNLVLEIQENSDTTYRITDWGRVDPKTGTPRELHLEQALKCISFRDRSSHRITGASDSVKHNRKFPIIEHCSTFSVDDLRLVDSWLDTTLSSKSCHLLTAINGAIRIENDRHSVEVALGYTVLIPANFGPYTIQLESKQETTVIKTTVR
jgi:mannose-6-phosphate isomerase